MSSAFKGWTTTHGIIVAAEEGRLNTRAQLAAVKEMIRQADRSQVVYLYDHLKPYLTEYGQHLLFGKRIPRRPTSA